MNPVPEAVTLAIEPDIWTIRLRNGDHLEVLAHSYSIEGDHCVFSLLFEGTPNTLVPSLRIPLALLEEGFN